MDLYIKSESSECDQFLEGNNHKKQLVKCQIAPLRVTGTEGNLKVVMGCNLWQACENIGCFYSKTAREKTEKVPSR